MKPLSTLLFERSVLAILVLGMLLALSYAAAPRPASAAVVNVTSVTATSTNLYENTGFATTSRVTTGDTVNYQLTLSATPWIAPQINIFSMGSTTMSGSGANWFYSTTSAVAWTEGPVTFRISVGSTTAATVGTTTVTQASVTTNVTQDETSPTLNSVSWSDVDGSTQFSASDTLTLTFSETMATSTITADNVDTTLALSGSHTFGTTPTVSWNTAGTILTLTLGTSPTVATADTVDPSTAVKDSVGIADATVAAVAITDNISPSNPTGLTDTTNRGSVRVVLTSTGSSRIRYTTDGTTPTCSTGTLYSAEFTIAETTTLKAIGCDEADNASSVVTATYTITASGSSGSSSSRTSTAATPAIPAVQMEKGCTPGAAFNTMTGKSCTVKATPASPSRAFQANLSAGSSGSDVKALQQFLNTHGYTVATSGAGSSGNETSVFGALTRAALIRYQQAKGITPAVGFFGPITRAAINAEK